MTTRREFLQTGVAGSLLLGVVGCSRPSADGGRARVIAALAPAILAGALPTGGEERRNAIDRTVSGVEKAIAGLSAATQKEIGQLFDLLGFAPTRILVAGLWPTWESAQAGEVAAFLASWRHSRFDLLRTGYAGLHDLIFGAWYAQAEAWPVIGYPGPPELR